MKTILVIEDDKDIRDSLSTLLSMEGYEVRTANNGQEGLVALREPPPPNLVLLDLMMPVKDGYQYSEEHHQDAKLANVPIVVMSADARLDQKKEKLQARAYLRKPLDIDELLNMVQRFCV